MSLKKKASVGAAWSLINALFLKGSVFFVSLYLASILGPNDFGLIGMISVFFYLGNIILESGLSESLIRTQKITEKDLSTIFYMNIAMALFIYFVFYTTAPFVSIFYDQEILTDLIRVYCLSFIFNAFSAVQMAILNKEMKFKKITVISIPAHLLGCILGVLMALNNYGVWSIVYMQLGIRVIQSISLWLFSKWKPSLIFSFTHLKIHLKFGYNLMLSGIIDTIFNNIYNIIIGKYFTVIQLGFYERANSMKTYPVITLSGIIHKVTYPLLSGIQDDKEKMAQVYRKMLRISFFFIAPTMLGMGALATPLFQLILGSEWMDAVPYFQILCLSAIFYPVHAFNVNILKVCGRSDLFLKSVIIKKALILSIVLIAIGFSIEALLWSTLVTSIIGLFINTYFNKNLINYSIREQLSDLIYTTIITVTMGAIVLTFINYNLPIGSLFNLLLGTLIGILSYGVLSFLFNKTIFTTVVKLIK